MIDPPSHNTDRELEAWARLSLARDIGPGLAHRLVNEFGSAAEVFDADAAGLLQVSGMGERRVSSLRDPALPELARREIDRARELGARVTHPDAADYPRALAQTANPPSLLYIMGELAPGDLVALAVVGPRSPSDYAREMTRALAPPLCAFGITIVSGLAMGIDHEAHQAALDAGGRTIGVVAQGLDQPISPAGARRLARRIIDEGRGAIISPFPLGTKSFAANFANRNWLIAALSLGVLVVEAGERSGSLITAACAADLGRPALACPGDATRLNARGSNALIKEGAALVQSSDDVIEALAGDLRRARRELGVEAPAARGDVDAVDEVDAANEVDTKPATAPDGEREPASKAGLLGRLRRRGAKSKVLATGPEPTPPAVARAPADPLEALIFNELALERRSVDYLLDACARAGHSQSAVIQKLLMLEMSDAVRQLPGRVYQLVTV